MVEISEVQVHEARRSLSLDIYVQIHHQLRSALLKPMEDLEIKGVKGFEKQTWKIHK